MNESSRLTSTTPDGCARWLRLRNRLDKPRSPNGDGRDFAEKTLIHQIHPAKLATDWLSAFLAAWLLWQHHLMLGLAVGILPAPIATVLVMRLVDLEPYRDSAFGRYVLRYMTPLAQAVRLLGAAVFWLAAWFHLPLGMVVGIAVILAGWSWGLAVRTPA